MLEFVNRMSTEQIMDFFQGVGEFVSMKQSASQGMQDVFFQGKDGEQFWYSIADNYICAAGYNKTSEDWKFYMLNLFGEEYLKEYGEKPIENNFVKNLSLMDVKALLAMNQIFADEIREASAFQKGTRRFKYKVASISSHIEKEVIIGPHLLFCDGIPMMTETSFMKFFTQRFGMDFINYYIEIEREEANKKIEAYASRCNEQLSRKMEFMVKIWENN